MNRFVLYYRGKDLNALEVTNSLEVSGGLKIVDHEHGRLWLVEGDKAEIQRQFGNRADWSVSEESSMDASW